MKKVVALDPGRIRDGFGMVAANVDPNTINLLNAKIWYKKDFHTVSADIAEIHKKVHFDVFLCESNNQGHPAIDVLKRFHNIHCIPITTVKEVKDKEKLRQGNSMPKNVTVEWVEWAIQKGIILMPKKPWLQGIRKLDEQMLQYVRRTTSSGTKYEAADPDIHDDLVSCLLTLSHYCRIKLLKLGYRDTSVLVGKKYPTILDTTDTPEEKAEINIRNRLKKKFPNTSSFKFNVRLPK